MNGQGWVAALALVPLLAIAAHAQPVDPVTQLKETNACPLCDLSNANLSGIDLTGANLQGAMLLGANLSRTDLTRANLSRAILNGADLSGASFRFANLENATLLGARLNPPADFTGANLNGMTMPSGAMRPLNPQRR